MLVTGATDRSPSDLARTVSQVVGGGFANV
jgi:hypothetical protein